MKSRIMKWVDDMGLTEEDALRISRELLERAFTPETKGLALLNKCREVISLGVKALNTSSETVNFAHAVDKSLEERSERRVRTVYEIGQICRRFMRNCPELSTMNLRDINSSYCYEILKINSSSPLQFTKSRAILHSIFSYGIKNGWCSVNPVNAIPRPKIKETEIESLPFEDIKKLLRTAQMDKFKACLPAVGIMLWAGVRPSELLRLSWEDIDWEEKIINLRPKHTKTGGCRHITLHPVLIEWLKKSETRTGKICPPNWANRWKKLRDAAGIHHWQQDVLRHTFASYHLKNWHDIGKLQEEMGHRSARLLQTRYLSMKGITREQVKLFWTPGKLY